MKAQFSEAYAGRRVLVTGHTGFKGSWLVLWLHRLGARVTGVALDPPGSPSLFQDARVGELCEDRRADIRDYEALERVVRESEPEVVFHLAAQALVRPSYAQPLKTLSSNVMGTAHLLEACRRVASARAIVVVTSDKCYQNNEWTWGYRENDPLGGRDPYSASKACAELVTSAYTASFFTPQDHGGRHHTAVASARAGNVIGGGDWAQDRLVPDCVRAFRAGRSVSIRSPLAVRPWQHVLECLSGYLLLGQRLLADGPAGGGAWNFAPLDRGDLWTVERVARRVAQLWGQGADCRVESDGVLHEATLLALDASRASAELGWRPRWSVDQALERSVAWYKAWNKKGDPFVLRKLCMAQIDEYAPECRLSASRVAERQGEERERERKRERERERETGLSHPPPSSPGRKGMFDQALRERILELVRSNSPKESLFVPGETRVPASGKVVGNREMEFMTEAVLDGWLTTGRFNERFERALADWLDARWVMTVNSGSSANLAALSALTSPELGERAIRPGDEVITVAAGFPTTIAPILQAGAVPVFVDVDADTWNVDVSLLEGALSPRTRAVMLAHTLGMPFDAEAVAHFCEVHGLWLVEDCCDALGSEWNGRQVGGFGHLGTLSFYPAHHITTGEGGAVFTGDARLARLVESFRDWGRHCRCRPGQDNACGQRFSGRYGDLPEGYDHKYVYSHAGYNLKMTDMTAACGLAQMERLPDFIRARREHYAYLRARLEDCPFIGFPHLPEQARPSWFGFPALLNRNAPLSRPELLQALEARGVGTRLPFAGNATRQPFMRSKPHRVAGTLTHTDELMERGFWLGVWPGLSHAMLDYAADSLRQVLSASERKDRP